MKLITLMYHAVLSDGKRPRNFYQIDEGQFRQQLECIKNSGILVTDIVKVESLKGAQLPALMLTFDDGDITAFEVVAPLLEGNNLRGHFFITVDRVGSPGMMHWQHIEYLKDQGHIIGSHGMTHRILTGLSDSEIERELRDSKSIFEKRLAMPIRYFSIPCGFYNSRIIQKAKEAGYEAVFTSDIGYNTQVNSGTFSLRRIPIRRSLSRERFIHILSGKKLIQEKIQEAAKRCAQALFGARQYQKLTRKVYAYDSAHN